MKKSKLTRRDFIKASAVTTAAAAAVVAGKEILETKDASALVDDVEPKPQLSCLDYLKALQQKS